MPTKKNKKIYTLNDYKNGDGMLTAVWGPSLWHYLHIMSFNYLLNQQTKIKQITDIYFKLTKCFTM